MNKEIKYGGYSANPNDHEALEGDLCVAMNLIPEHNTIRPVLPPKVIAQIPGDPYNQADKGRRILCIHQTSAYKHFIVAIDFGGLSPQHPPYTNLYYWDGEEGSNPERIGAKSFALIYKVEPVGNTLVVLADDGVHYILWSVDDNQYRYLGQKPPRIDITFGLSSELVAYPGWKDNGDPAQPAWASQSWTDDRQYMPIPATELSPRSASDAGTDNQQQLLFYPKDVATQGEQTSNLLIWGAGGHSYKDSDDEQTKIEIDNITAKVMAAVNKLIVEEGDNKGRFIMPFFVRYAYRLFDDSVVMHSYPVLMIPNSRGPFFGLNGCTLRETGHRPGVEIFAQRINDNLYIQSYTFRGRAYAFASRLCYEASFHDLDDWKDIIHSVDVYVSAPVFTVNQAEKVYGWENMDDSGAWDNFYTIGRLADGTRVQGATATLYKKWMMSTVFPADTRRVVNGQTKYLYEAYNHAANPDQYPMPNYVMAVPEFTHEELMQRLTDITNFYQIHSFNMDELTGDHSSTPLSGVIDIKDGALKTLLSRDRMKDDFFTRDTVIARHAFAYNGRINLSGISRMQHKPLDPHIAWTKYDDGSNRKYNVAVRIPNQQRVNLLTSGQGQNDTSKPLFIFYPDPSATTAIVECSGTVRELKLKRHPFLWGAYWLGDIWGNDDEWGSQTPVTGSLPPEDVQPINEANKVYTSKVDNPFVFPSTSINSVGVGEIMGTCAAVRPVSTGQVGYANLYIFTGDGVWVAKIDQEGNYTNLDLISGDVCVNKDSITQTEESVLFATARGIMLLSGSQTQCVSEAIDDHGMLVSIIDQDGYSIPTRLASMLGMNMEPIGSFEYFLAECRMVYDYKGQRIIVYNPATSPVDGGFAAVYPYAYIYSLESNKWGMMQCNIAYSVRAYPAALAVNRDGELVDCSVGDGDAVVTQLLITRPLALDLPDVHKTVRAVLQRGLFRKRQGHVQSVLYGSRDLYNWHMVNCSHDEDMRGRHGTPYKVFRVALLLRLPADESVTGCSIQFDTKYINRLR